MKGDQAYCKYFNVENVPTDNTSDIIQKYYWRLVVATSNETADDNITLDIDGNTIITSEYHFIDLSKTDCDSQSDVPQAQDTIVQLGHKNDANKERQNAIIMAGAGDGSPYIRQYVGINSFSLPEPETQIKPNENILSGNTKFRTSQSTDKSLGALNKEANETKQELNKQQNSISSLEETTQEQSNKIAGHDEEIKQQKQTIDNLVSGVNILRNSGFTGDYEITDLDIKDSLDATSREDFYSPSLKYWQVKGTVYAENSTDASSGKLVHFYDANSSITQTPHYSIVQGATYILSFIAPMNVDNHIYVQFDDDKDNTIEIHIDDTLHFTKKFNAAKNYTTITIATEYECVLYDISLIQGTVPISYWQASPLDNRKEQAGYESMTYLRDLLVPESIIDGNVISTGVVNAGRINMGEYDKETKRIKITSGINGICNEKEDSVAFFGGGDLSQAIYAVSKYKNDPTYIPTQEELASMAKAVITHGGRAILQDIILRGYVYAEGGVFNGTVYANGGVFNGVLKAQLSYSPTTIITKDHYNIDMQKTPCSYYAYKRNVSLNNDTNTFVYLPSAKEYEGLELTFNILDQGAGIMFHYLEAIEGEEIEIPLNAAVVKAANNEWITIECMPLERVTKRRVAMTGRGEYVIRAIDGKWYATKGLWTGE
jgi:hypothetical protein